MDNCTYNKIKILHEMSKLNGFIEKYGRKDARASKHRYCSSILDHLHQDLQKHLRQLHQQLKQQKL